MSTLGAHNYQAGVRKNIETGYASGIKSFQRIKEGDAAGLYVPPTAKRARAGMSTRFIFTPDSVALFNERVGAPLQRIVNRYGAKGIFPGEGDENFHSTHQSGIFPGSAEAMPSLNDLDDTLRFHLIGQTVAIGEAVPGVAITARFLDPDVMLFYACLIAEQEYVRKGFRTSDYRHYRGVTAGRLIEGVDADLIGLDHAIKTQLNGNLKEKPFEMKIEDVESMTQYEFAKGSGIVYI